MKKILQIFFFFLLISLSLPSNLFASNCNDIGPCPLSCPSSCPSTTIRNPVGGMCQCIPLSTKPSLKIGSYTLTSLVYFTNLGSILSQLLPYIFVIAGIILFFIIVLNGFSFLTSGGDPKKVESAKSGLTSALIGFLIIFVSYWLLQLLEVVFHIKIL